MRLNDHYKLGGMHAIISPSKYSWVNYTEEQFDAYMHRSIAAQRGTELHELAANLIRMRIRLPETRVTINEYVNDAIGWRMTPEQTLFYSENCFGTADAISYSESAKTLRIHDLKTGVTPASMTQLKIYAAIFCLEYRIKPADLDIELRIYQNDLIAYEPGNVVEITAIMRKIVDFDNRARKMKKEAE